MRPARDILIWSFLGVLGVVLLAWAFPRVYPLVPEEWEVTAAEARTVALEALRDLGEPVADAYVVVNLASDQELERRLQTASAGEPERLAGSRLAQAQLRWDVLVYRLGVRPGEWTYRALVSPRGEVLMLRRLDPGGTDPDVDDETVRRLGAEYLLGRGFDLDLFETPGEVLRSQFGNRHDVRLQLRSEEALLGPRYSYGVQVFFAGREVAGFGLWYDDPDRAEVQRALRPMQLFDAGTLVTTFLLLPWVAVPFLRRYHDGQLGVRRGVQILLLTLGAATVFVVANRHGLSEGNAVGLLTRRQMTWVSAGFTFIFYNSSAAVLGLMSWSVGEFLCRQSHPQKLASIDALFRWKWTNATVARASLSGVAGGLLMAGGLLALAVPLQALGVWAPASAVYRDALGSPLGWLSTVAASYAGVLPFLLFSAFLVPSWVRRRSRSPWLALAAAWLALSAFSPFLIALPLRWSWAIWALVALVPALLFHFGDLLAALLAGVVSYAALLAAPALFAGDPRVELNGYAALLLAAAPLLVGARHLLGEEEFVYTWDDVPPHVRRIAERERQRVELETAAEIQSSILPALPAQLHGVEIACTYLPATEVGGDFYDVLALEDGRLAVAVGDVAGHGVSSGLVMAMAKSALAVQVTFDPEVESVFRTLNRMVYQSSRRRLLATLCYALVDPRRRELRYGSAGHIYPYRISLAGNVQGLETASYPLGVRGEIAVPVRTARLAPSDAIFLCSDGLVEACPGESAEPFGFDRLEASLRRHAGRPPGEMRDGVLADLVGYLGRRPWEDDLTILVLRLPAG